VAAQAAPAPRHGEVLLRQREVGVDQRGEVVRGVAAAAAEQRAVRALEPALGHAAHPAERAGGAGARGVVAAAGRHGLPHGAHLFLGGVRGPASARAAAAAGRAVGLAPAAPRGRVGEHERGRHLAGFQLEVGPSVGPADVPRRRVVRARRLFGGVERAEPQARAPVGVADLSRPAGWGL
jgi:hypothetical protein